MILSGSRCERRKLVEIEHAVRFVWGKIMSMFEVKFLKEGTYAITFQDLRNDMKRKSVVVRQKLRFLFFFFFFYLRTCKIFKTCKDTKRSILLRALLW